MLLTRRLFASCALCATTGLVATQASAQSSGITRSILQQTDGPGDGYVSYLVRADIAAGALVARHIHPGVESTYFLTGQGELIVQGQPSRQIKAGEGFQIPAYVPHSLQNGPAPTTIAATYIIEKGKPLAIPAPE